MKKKTADNLSASSEAGLLLAGALCLAAVLLHGRFDRPRGAPFPRVGQLSGGEFSVSEEAGPEISSIGGWRGLLLGNPLDLNGAASEDLMALPGVGEKTAAKILLTREKLGGFSEVGDIRKTPSIGKVRYGRLKEWLTVSERKFAEGEK
ncbi:hypothetical protein EPN96_11055 [bacterium]|nr:MAG: hypothetical protein EPN96_11055 [bacterium]